jgi:hypothetical protein
MTFWIQPPPSRGSPWIFRLGKQPARYRGAHKNAFLDFAEMPHEVLYDNMRMVVLERHGFVRGRHRFHPAFSTLPGIVVQLRLPAPYQAQITDVIDNAFSGDLDNLLSRTGDRVAKSRARRASPAAQPLSSLLLCGARARLWPPWVPAGNIARVSGLGLLDPTPFLVAMALEVAGVRCSLLSARRPGTDFELELQWPSTYSRIVIFIEVSQLNFT